MHTIVIPFLTVAVLAGALQATEFHVAPNGNDAAPGTGKTPLRTIQRAADIAQPGDTITVHAGTYRERINPPRGGTSNGRRILYRAAPGELVEIKGSERITGWVQVQPDVWKVTLPNSFFGGFNPYNDLIRGDWFERKGRDHHTGAVYLDSDWLTEATRLEEVLMPAGTSPEWVTRGNQETGLSPRLWFGRVDGTHTTLWAQFKAVNPNEHQVEINVRQTVFYPDHPGRNFITVRGFTMSQAATPWAPPTAEQIGLIGTHWSKGWIIENNIVSHSTCSGIALGKHGDEFDNQSANSAEGYIKTIERAHAHAIPWTRENIGHHIVRNNQISHCEQTGIVGSLGCSFSTITGNSIHQIHRHRLFTGAEMAGIKLHGAIDVEISHNHIHQTCLGLWLDWMAQGARITGNLLHDNSVDLFLEMLHGPTVVDNNLFLSTRRTVDLNCQGMAFAHNLFAGSIRNYRDDKRSTPYHPPHSTAIAGLYPAPRGDSGDHRFQNNLLAAPCKLQAVDNSTLPCSAEGNVFLAGAEPSRFDTGSLVDPDPNATPKLEHRTDGWYLTLTEDKAWRRMPARQRVSTESLGKTLVSDCTYENPDGTPLQINLDYFGNRRAGRRPFPGPFERVKDGPQEFKVWPLHTTPPTL